MNSSRDAGPGRGPVDAAPKGAASSPGATSSRFRATLARAGRGLREHEVGTEAAAVAFFVLLAIFPGLAASLSLLGLFVDPERAGALLRLVSGLLPPTTVEVVARQISRLAEVTTSPENARTLAFAPYIGFAVLLSSSNKGMAALVRALNRIYEHEETRGFLLFMLVSLLFTLGATACLVLATGAILVLPLVLEAIGLDAAEIRTIGLLRWAALLVAGAGVLIVLLRYGPSREPGSWAATTASSFAAAFLWIVFSLLFSWYVSTFGFFSEIYGPLGAMVGFMVWIWLSVVAVLVGAELDAAWTGAAAAGARRGPTRGDPVRGRDGGRGGDADGG